MPVTRFIARQLRKPSGWFGTHVVAWLLDRFNAPMNTQALDLLAVQSTDRVLEVGFGGGDLLGRIASLAAEGFVAGVDFSPEMVARSARRHRVLVEEGRMALRCADAHALPYPDGHFTKACTVNTLYFWEDPARVLGAMHRVLVDGGVLVVGFSPKDEMKNRPFVAHGFTLYSEGDVRRLMETAGFDAVRSLPGQAGKHPVFCAVGTKRR